MGKHKEPEADPMQILADFYNLNLEIEIQFKVIPEELSQKRQTGILHIRTGKISDSSQLSLPDAGRQRRIEAERQRIIAFFRGYCPNALAFPDLRSVEKEVEEWQRVGLPAWVHEGTLGWYEYLERTSWFESDDFFGFVDHWLAICQLLDGIIAGLLHLSLFHWFQHHALTWQTETPQPENHGPGYRLNVRLIDPNGQPSSPQHLIWDKHKTTVPLGTWKVETTDWSESVRFGLAIGKMLENVHRCLIAAMSDSSMFGRCKAGATPRRPPCANLFLRTRQRGKPRTWCSETCKNRIYEAEKRERIKLTIKTQK